MSMQDSQNAKKQFGPELYSYLLLHGRGHQSWLSWLARRASCLLEVAAVQFLLLERETLADHYRATSCQIPVTWWGRVRYRCSPGNLPQIKCFAMMTIITDDHLWWWDSLEKLWQQGVPWTAVLFQREKQLEGGHCTGVTLDGPYPPAHVVILEVNEESASPENTECHVTLWLWKKSKLKTRASIDNFEVFMMTVF